MSFLHEHFRNRSVLITGGLGFIGSSLAHRLLELGAQVTLVDSLIPEYGGNLFNVRDIRDRVWVNISDVRDPYAMKHLVQGKDVLFNLAGQTSHLDSMTDPVTDLEINCKAQLSLLETCRQMNPKIRVVFAGTRQIYGKPDYLPVDENHPIRPVDVNGINKTAGEWYHLLYCANHGIPCSVLRLTNTYGPRMLAKDARQTFLGVWLKLLIQGEPIQIFGDGTQRRDFNYVDDVVDAMLRVAASDNAIGKIYNLGSDEVVSLQDLAKLMLELNGSGEYRIVPFPKDLKKIDVGDYCGDFRSINKAHGWKPETSLREGLRRTLAFYKDHWRNYWT
jgi:UDP-glucose 4-epimerase